MQVHTENGALSVTPDNPLVNLFYKTVRNIPQDHFYQILEEAWGVSQIITLKLLFYIRWCRGGKGEKQIFRWGLRKLVEMGYGDIVVKNLSLVPEFGSWKDLLYLLDTPIKGDVLKVYCEQIRKDLYNLQHSNMNVSLAGKWLPSQQKSMDRSMGAAKSFRKELKMSFKEYRQTCTALRKRISLVETEMCAGDFDQINYASVPSLARLKYAKAFQKRDPERYKEYLDNVAAGHSKMNVKLVYPYQLVEKYLYGGKKDYPDDKTLNTMWDELVRQIRADLVISGANLQALGVADVSGSMMGLPLYNSVSLSLLWSELCEGPFKGHFYTFSSQPQLIQVSGKTLQEKVENVTEHMRIESTNIQALFEDLLKWAKMWRVPKEQYPRTIYIFTDGQFDSMTESSGETNFDVIRKKHLEAGYPVPQIVFWNLRGDTLDFPTSANEKEVALVSGFSPSLLNLFLSGQSMNPVKIMLSAISDKMFEKITV